MTKRVLVCDDAIFMRRIIGEILVQNGFSVAGEAADGHQAIEKYKETKPDIVIMDITMPELNGIEALKEILKYDQDAAVIMCSAMGQQAMIKESLQAGAKEFIIKPFQPDQVIEAVKNAME